MKIIEKKRERKILSVGLQVEEVSKIVSDLHIRQDQVTARLYYSRLPSNALKETLETQRDWTRHHIGDPNQYKHSVLFTFVDTKF